MIVEENSFLSKLKYMSFFITRAILIAVICFFSLLFILLFIYFGDLLLNVKSGNYKNPIFNGYVIVSQSMVPTININDAIVIKRNKNYNIGDIISFFSTEYEREGMVVTHRIVDKDSDYNKQLLYTTKGDNNTIPDSQGVYSDSIYGKVMFIIPKLGYLQNFLSKPLNLICCIIFPAIMILVCDFVKIGLLFNKNIKRSGVV